MIEPARVDPLVASMSTVIGGPRGRHAQGYVRWLPTSAVIVALTTLTFVVGLWQKADCVGSRWTSSIRYTHMCASDLPGAYTSHGLDRPALSSYWEYALATLTHALHDSVVLFVVLNGVGLALVALAAAYALSRVRPERGWDAAAFAIAPGLALTGLISTDLIAVAAVAGALWAYARGRHGLTGSLIGLGAAAAVYPVVLLVGVAALTIRRGAGRAYLVTVMAAVGTWLVINVPAMLAKWEAWSTYWSHLVHRDAGPGSIWLVIQDSSEKVIPGHIIAMCLVILMAAWLIGTLLLGVTAREEPTLAQLGFLCVVGVLVFGDAYTPQNVLWLLPLAALAHPRWRDQLGWQGAELLFFCATWWNLADLMSSGDGASAMYDITIVIRVAAELAFAALVVCDLTRPQTMTVSSKVVVV